MSTTSQEELATIPDNPPPSYSDDSTGLPEPHKSPESKASEPILRQPFKEDFSQAQAGNLLSKLQDATGYFIEQMIHVADVAVCWHSQCQFTVRNQRGDNVFYVKESSNICCRQCFRVINPFRLEFKDADGQNVFVVERGVNCSCCCAMIMPDTIDVWTADGQLVGKIQELPHIFYPNYKAMDSIGNKVLKIEGPFLPRLCTLCRRDLSFAVKDWKSSTVGTITKEWTNFPQELFSDADNYSIFFAADLEPSLKCLLLAALFLVNYEFFEGGFEHQFLTKVRALC